MSEDNPGSAAARERAATDSGLTGDKVAGSDPAAAPLGTDAEASGHAAEADGPRAATADGDTAARDPNRSNAARPKAPWLWIVLAVVAAAVLAVVLASGTGG